MRKARTSGGFTLIEVMLVLGIVAVLTALTMPSFVISMRGNRLRHAARTIVMAGRYARSMAILKQREMALGLDLDKGIVTIFDAAAPPPPAGEEPAEGHPARESGAFEPFDSSASNAPAASAGAADITRVLDGVKIDWVEIEGQEKQVQEGACRLPYFNNGTCTPYEVRVVDEFGTAVRVKVDSLRRAARGHLALPGDRQGGALLPGGGVDAGPGRGGAPAGREG